MWSGPCLESLMGHGLERIPRVGCDTRGGAAPGVSPPRPLRRVWRGRKWRERPPNFGAGAPPGRGDGARQNSPSPLSVGGRSLHRDPWREGHRALFRAHGGCVYPRVTLWPDCCSVCWCVSLCCAVCRFTSASLPRPVNASSASAPRGTSTSAPGCASSLMRPSKNSRPQMARGREGQG